MYLGGSAVSQCLWTSRHWTYVYKETKSKTELKDYFQGDLAHSAGQNFKQPENTLCKLFIAVL